VPPAGLYLTGVSHRKKPGVAKTDGFWPLLPRRCRPKAQIRGISTGRAPKSQQRRQSRIAVQAAAGRGQKTRENRIACACVAAAIRDIASDLRSHPQENSPACLAIAAADGALNARRLLGAGLTVGDYRIRMDSKNRGFKEIGHSGLAEPEGFEPSIRLESV
jgi:hypothetical protein